ncbi:MAG: type 4a pilus biogenesis protein PilO [Candidatus Omnitrophica bacterium]|nr:type 4a pilus biogenesis protein PilO [Candidatus Omnitrophota bacterium]
MKVNLSQQEQRTVLLVAVLALFIGWVYVVYVLGPMWKEIRKTQRTIQQQSARIRELELAAQNIGAVQRQHDEKERAVKALKSQLPLENDVAVLVAQLTDLANTAQMKIENIFPERSSSDSKDPKNPKDQKPKALRDEYQPVNIQIEGSSGYHQLGTFLSLVEGVDKPMQLASLQIQGNLKSPKRHRIKLVLRAYVASTEEASKG